MDHKKLLILFLCQGLYWSTVIVGVALSSVVGAQLAPSPSLATLPLALLVLGNLAATLPLSLTMQRFGRRVGFALGALACIISGAIAAYGIYQQHFWLFCLSNMGLGLTQASALYYRLAATDDLAPQQQGRAIAWVMAGGIVAAIIAPSLAIWSKDLLLPHLFVGSYALVSVLGLLSLLLCLLLPNPGAQTRSKPLGGGRKMSTIIRQPVFVAAISNTAIGNGIMILIMVSTPLAMLACHHSINSATQVIQWHILGMFIPAFFTGQCIDRYGASAIALWGAGVLAISVIISLLGTQLLHFYSGLFLLGIGWNFIYTAGSTMMTQSHQPVERGRVQGSAELIIGLLAALGAFSSGPLLHHFGWQHVNWGSLPLLAMAVGVNLWYHYKIKAERGK